MRGSRLAALAPLRTQPQTALHLFNQRANLLGGLGNVRRHDWFDARCQGREGCVDGIQINGALFVLLDDLLRVGRPQLDKLLLNRRKSRGVGVTEHRQVLQPNQIRLGGQRRQ